MRNSREREKIQLTLHVRHSKTGDRQTAEVVWLAASPAKENHTGKKRKVSYRA